jgi:hypothetical protein
MLRVLLPFADFASLLTQGWPFLTSSRETRHLSIAGNFDKVGSSGLINTAGVFIRLRSNLFYQK